MYLEVDPEKAGWNAKREGEEEYLVSVIHHVGNDTSYCARLWAVLIKRTYSENLLNPKYEFIEGILPFWLPPCFLPYTASIRFCDCGYYNSIRSDKWQRQKP